MRWDLLSREQTFCENEIFLWIPRQSLEVLQESVLFLAASAENKRQYLGVGSGWRSLGRAFLELSRVSCAGRATLLEGLEHLHFLLLYLAVFEKAPASGRSKLGQCSYPFLPAGECEIQ